MHYTPFFRKTYIPDLKLSGYKRKYISPEIDEEIHSVESEIPDINEEHSVKKTETIIPETPKDLFSLSYMNAGGDENKYAFFRKLAEKESGLDPHIQNLQGAPAYGYFQFMQDGKRWNNISTFANTDIETFRNNPEIQIQAAHKLSDAFLKEFSAKDITKARELGFTDSALVAGAWLAGVGGVRKYLHKGISLDDKHWSSDGKIGTDVETRMKEFNGMFKDGGVLKFASGDLIPDAKAFVSDWYTKRKNILRNNSSKLSLNTLNNLKSNVESVKVHVAPHELRDVATAAYTYNTHSIATRENPDRSTLIHEITHASKPIYQKKAIKHIKDKFGDLMYNTGIIPDDYWDTEEEIYARLMQVRDKYNLDPNHKYSLDEVNDLIKKAISEYHLIQHTEDGVRESKYSPSNVITHIEPYNGKMLEGKVFMKYDSNKDLEFLNRYSPEFIMSLLNDVASTKKLPEGVAYAQSGMQFVPPMLRRNSEDYNYRFGEYDANTKHWNSRNPKTGLILKGKNHPTFNLAYEEDQKLGYKWRRGFDGQLYSDAPWEIRPGVPYINTKHEGVLKGFKGVEDVYKHILNLGASPEEAAAWTGVFIQESGLKHNNTAASGATGIAQLKSDELNNYKQYLNSKKLPDTWENQINYIWDQIHNGEHVWSKDYFRLLNLGDRRTAEQERLFQSMDKSKWGEYSYENYRETVPYDSDPQHIAETFTWTFERPGAEEVLMDKRKKYAQAVYDKYGK